MVSSYGRFGVQWINLFLTLISIQNWFYHRGKWTTSTRIWQFWLYCSKPELCLIKCLFCFIYTYQTCVNHKSGDKLNFKNSYILKPTVFSTSFLYTRDSHTESYFCLQATAIDHQQQQQHTSLTSFFYSKEEAAMEFLFNCFSKLNSSFLHIFGLVSFCCNFQNHFIVFSACTLINFFSKAKFKTRSFATSSTMSFSDLATYKSNLPLIFSKDSNAISVDCVPFPSSKNAFNRNFSTTMKFKVSSTNQNFQ